MLGDTTLKFGKKKRPPVIESGSSTLQYNHSVNVDGQYVGIPNYHFTLD